VGAERSVLGDRSARRSGATRAPRAGGGSFAAVTFRLYAASLRLVTVTVAFVMTGGVVATGGAISVRPEV